MRFACGAWAFLFVASFGSPGVAEGPKKIVSVEGITEYRLENGLQVLLFPDASRPTVTVNLTVFVGSRHEGYGETGMAHLLEHMVFKGSPKHPKIPKALQDRGAEFNGTTWVDRTNYYETLPATDDNLAFALDLEADRMVNSFIKREDLLSEMTVVRNEFEQGENDPGNILEQRMVAAAFEWHNYGKSTIGNRSDIERVPIDNLQAFYRKYYQPDNAMLVVAGKFDEAKALAMIEKTFGKIPRPKRKLLPVYTEEPEQDGERQVTLRRVGDLAVVGLAYHIPAGAHPDFVAVEVLDEILTDTPTGRLYRKIVESKLATGVFGLSYAWHDPGLFGVFSEIRDVGNVDKVREILIDTVESLAKEGVTQAEVDRAKERILKQRELAAGNTSRLAVQLSEWAAQGDWRLYFLHRDRMEKVTAEQCKKVAEAFLRRNNRTLGVFLPTKAPDRTPIPATPSIAEMMANYKGRATLAAGEEFDVAPAAIESRVKRLTLDEGLKVGLLSKKTRGETVEVTLTLRYGDLESLKGKNMAASVLPELMTRGTKTKTFEQIRGELDKLRATLNASGSAGVASFSVSTKKAYLPKVLGLLKEVLREPSLPAAELDIIKQRNLARLEEQRSDPQAQALTTVRRTVAPYPQDDVRYIPTIEESIARMKAVDRDAVESLWRDFLGANAGELAIVGDFNADEVVTNVKDLFAGWKSSKAYARLPLLVHPAKGQVLKVETPDKANSFFFGGLVMPMNDLHPDYAAMVVNNFILGGGSLSSRLGDRVRQKDGLSYGVASMFRAEAQDERASINIYAICNPNNMTKLEKAIREEIDILLAKGVTEDELARAKQSLIQEMQVDRANDKYLTSIVSESLHLDRSIVHYAELESRLNVLSVEQVKTVLKKWLDPKKMVIAEAGDFANAAKYDSTPKKK